MISTKLPYGLTLTEARIYQAIVKADGQPATHTEIVKAIGYPSAGADDGKLTRVHIHNLRTKLPWQMAGEIETAIGIGYYWSKGSNPYRKPESPKRRIVPVEVTVGAVAWVEAQRVAR